MQWEGVRRLAREEGEGGGGGGGGGVGVGVGGGRRGEFDDGTILNETGAKSLIELFNILHQIDRNVDGEIFFTKDSESC